MQGGHRAEGAQIGSRRVPDAYERLCRRGCQKAMQPERLFSLGAAVVTYGRWRFIIPPSRSAPRQLTQDGGGGLNLSTGKPWDGMIRTTQQTRKPRGIVIYFDTPLITHAMWCRCLGASSETLLDASKGDKHFRSGRWKPDAFIIYRYISLCSVADSRQLSPDQKLRGVVRFLRPRCQLRDWPRNKVVITVDIKELLLLLVNA